MIEFEIKLLTDNRITVPQLVVRNWKWKKGQRLNARFNGKELILKKGGKKK